jgi:murein DD-endopeptidase MepM/ murein hydrolase activator NlpD
MLSGCSTALPGEILQFEPVQTEAPGATPTGSVDQEASRDAEVRSDPTATPAQFDLPPLVAEDEQDWRPPPYEPPLALRAEDHYYFVRPLPSGQANWPHPEYRYGSTYFGENSTHTGVDLDGDANAPVLAAGSGVVTWTGYGLYRGIEDLSDPYGLAVAIRPDFGTGGETLYTAYAHMGSISVWTGQRVEAGEQIGTVGNTGHSTGPHLHFEVRLGANDYFSTVNPELWMVPPEGWGTLAGSLVDSLGQPLEEFAVQVRSLDSGRRWRVWTYAEGTIHPDREYLENFVLGDLPAGPYEVQIDYVGTSYETQLLILAGQTNLVRFHGRDGFSVEEPELTDEFSSPPIP